MKMKMTLMRMMAKMVTPLTRTLMSQSQITKEMKMKSLILKSTRNGVRNTEMKSCQNQDKEMTMMTRKEKMRTTMKILTKAMRTIMMKTTMMKLEHSINHFISRIFHFHTI